MAFARRSFGRAFDAAFLSMRLSVDLLVRLGGETAWRTSVKLSNERIGTAVSWEEQRLNFGLWISESERSNQRSSRLQIELPAEWQRCSQSPTIWRTKRGRLCVLIGTEMGRWAPLIWMQSLHHKQRMLFTDLFARSPNQGLKFRQRRSALGGRLSWAPTCLWGVKKRKKATAKLQDYLCLASLSNSN